MKNFLAAIAVSMFLFSCGGGEAEPEMEIEETEEVSLRDQAASEVTLELGGTDEMKYTKETLSAPAGSTITLNFQHMGEMSVEAMGHNFVLLKQGTNLEEFAQNAMMMKDNGYLPEDMSNVIVHTNMIGGGESTSVTFEAPEPGTYQYVCTFPGHYGMMQGTLTIN